LRVKGIVQFADGPRRPAVVQAAQHALSAPEWLAAWPDGDRRSRLVFVVHDIARAEIIARFADASPRIVGTGTSAGTSAGTGAGAAAVLTR